jgi:hypothetical protein
LFEILLWTVCSLKIFPAVLWLGTCLCACERDSNCIFTS